MLTLAETDLLAQVAKPLMAVSQIGLYFAVKPYTLSPLNHVLYSASKPYTLSPLNHVLYSASVLQITAVRTATLVAGVNGNKSV